MRRNPYALAAVAAAAVPGMVPVSTVPIATPAEDLEVAGVTGEDGRRVIVACPVTAAAGAELEKSVRVADSLSGSDLRDLVPEVLGFVTLPEGGRAAVTAAPEGVPLMFDRLASDRSLAASLGATLARIHSLRGYAAEATGVESFSAAALRAMHRSQVARLRAAQHLPAAVSQRWVRLLEDDELWDFTPVFTHADLSEEALFAREGRISTVQGWASARIGDPATDLAWLVAALDAEAFDDLYAAYVERLAVRPHPRLLERAQAVGEFAVGDWLLHGLDAEDPEIVEDARGMLADLEADLAQLARDEAEKAFDALRGDRAGDEDDQPEDDRPLEADGTR
ncbi:phosphotransferase [Brachybacterium hainanense]|uniref:Phosphotransferase n=1 Tax=Brachybacterium hainanense TaxID=1541174 RepID=A0ABV6RH81_9MICO